MSFLQRCFHGGPWLTGLFLLWAIAVPVQAQLPVLEMDEQLDFDDPEAWAMKYFTTTSLMTGLGAVEERAPGSVDLGLELLQVPHLDQEQRTVGFGGFKEEDLNRSPVWARLRLAVGLPGRFNLVVGWAPPVEVEGVEANLVSLALEKVLVERGPWGLGLRLYGQQGEAEGDLTCTAGADERFPPGSPENPFGCEAPSSDTVTMDYYGAELNGSYRFSDRGPRVHLGVAWNSLDMEFQINAQTFGFLDRTRLLADGEIISVNAGATWQLAERSHFGLELFYAELDVLRRGESSTENDPLFNVRALLRYRVR